VSSPSITPPRSRAVACRLARGERELARHLAIRRAVFVDEQRLFGADDRDECDDDAATLHALGSAGGRFAGAVRLYPLGGGEWKGDRLAVLPEARRGLLGASLVRFAVATAGGRGGARMVAMIQRPNVAFFESLGWRCDGAVVQFHGRPHQPMAIDLG
jgi:putative N-acetyltransferase (TIGR04045 family)